MLGKRLPVIGPKSLVYISLFVFKNSSHFPVNDGGGKFEFDYGRVLPPVCALHDLVLVDIGQI